MRVLLAITTGALVGACTPTTQTPVAEPTPAAMANDASQPQQPEAKTDKLSVFLGDYGASAKISRQCDGITTTDVQTAGTIAREERGLGRQRVLQILYYGNRASLVSLAEQTLSARGVDPANTSALCRFGRKIAGQNDAIGRFLKVTN